MGQHGVGLVVNMLGMVVVARNFSFADFGFFSFLLAVFRIAAFVSEGGIGDRFANQFDSEGNTDQKNKRLAEALSGLVTTGIVLLFILLGAVILVNSSTYSLVPRLWFAAILWLAAFLQNVNGLAVSCLHITGKHHEVSDSLVRKHGLFLFLIWIITQTGNPVLLLAALLIPEIYHRVKLRKMVPLPWTLTTNLFSRSANCLEQSLAHLFCGEALSLIFHADLFILGMFVSFSQLGIYSEAILFGRFFLLIPFGVRPVLHRYFAKISLEEDGDIAAKLGQKCAVVQAYLFFSHALLGLILLNYFDDALHLFLESYGAEIPAFTLFTVMLPGFLFYAAIPPYELLLQVQQRESVLGKISVLVLALNVALNFYLIPFANIVGAAWGTVVSMLVYFFILQSLKMPEYRSQMFSFLFGGGIVYLFYNALEWIDFSLWLYVLLVPPLLYLAFYVTGFFDIDVYSSSITEENDSLKLQIRPEATLLPSVQEEENRHG